MKPGNWPPRQPGFVNQHDNGFDIVGKTARIQPSRRIGFFRASELRWLDEGSEREAVRLETTFEAGKSNGNNIWSSMGKNRLSQDKVKLNPKMSRGEI